MDKLRSVIGQKVFVVYLIQETIRRSDYGGLEEINEPQNIVLDKGSSGSVIVPINNGIERIIKVYDKQGFIVYDAEDKPKKPLRKR